MKNKKNTKRINHNYFTFVGLIILFMSNTPSILNSYNGYTILDLYFTNARLYNKSNALCSKRNNAWEKISISELIDKANIVSDYFLKKGVKKGDKIAIVSQNRYEWHVVDFAILQIGAISVPLYPNLNSADYDYIIKETKVKFLIVSNHHLYRNIKPIVKKHKSLQEIISFDKIENLSLLSDVLNTQTLPNIEKIKTLRDKIKQEDIASIIYTSGTTHTPKGVILSHLNVVSNVIDAKVFFYFVNEKYTALSFLPLNHIFERMVSYLYIYSGASIYFVESLEAIGDSMREVKPDIFIAVPRLIEKVFQKIMLKGSALTGIKRILFFWSIRVAEKYSTSPKHRSLLYNLKLAIARKLIFSKWQKALGGNIKIIVTGAAACQLKLLKIFNAAGIPIREGYGLTETSPVISVNTLEDFSLGTVGPIIPNVKVKIAEDGEILVKGPNIMQGYYKKSEETKNAFTTDGWFKTGDIGVLVDNKYLKITDRKKDIFKLSGGKYISPQYIENLLKSSTYIEQVMVVGSGEKFASAIIQPNWSSIEKWANTHNIPLPSSPSEVIKSTDILNLFKEEIHKVNQHLPQFENIKKQELVPDTWSVQTEELTPTMKLKRRVLYKKYQHIINKIYSSNI